MTKSQVTIVVVPRERFSYSKSSLESLYKNTTVPFKLIYIDGNSPFQTKHYLKLQAKQKGFSLICTNYFLSPNQARNLGLSKVDTKYVVFVDNDILFTQDWLNKLLQCAEETGAWVVGPLYYEGQLEEQIIHMAGGLAHCQDNQGRREYIEQLRFHKKPLAEVHSYVRREVTELVEFHCVLVNMEVFKQLGPLDEKLISTAEHSDMCMTVRKHGGEVYLEPNAIVSYVLPPPLALSDLPYFFLRWSDRWNRESLSHFCEKWNVPEDDPFIKAQYEWLTYHRKLVFRLIRHILPIKHTPGWSRNILLLVDKQLNKLLYNSK